MLLTHDIRVQAPSKHHTHPTPSPKLLPAALFALCAPLASDTFLVAQSRYAASVITTNVYASGLSVPCTPYSYGFTTGVSHPSLEKCSKGLWESAGKVVVGIGDVAVMVVMKTGGMTQLMDDDGMGMVMGMGIVAVEFGLIWDEEGEEAVAAGDVELEDGVILLSRFAIDGAKDTGAVVADALAGAVGVAVVVTVAFNAADMGQ